VNLRSLFFIGLGSAIAVSALAGSLLVGDSVGASLRDLAVRQLGATTHVIEAPGFVREALATDLRAQPGFAGAFGEACPLIALHGFAVHDPRRRRSLQVSVFGVGDCFWRQGGRDVTQLEPDEAYVSASLADELGARAGDVVRVHVVKPSRVPVESLFGARDDLSVTVRVTVKGALSARDLGEFSLRPRSGPVRAVFLRLARLQRAIDRARQVNTILIGGRDSNAAPGRLQAILRDVITLEDIGVTVRVLPGRNVVAVETRSGLVSEDMAADASRAIAAIGARATPVLSYLVDAIQLNDRRIPYSFVTAMDLSAFQPTIANRQSAIDLSDPPIVLTDWAARRLGARAGDTVWLSYSVWAETGRLQSETARFRVSAVVPIDPAVWDRELVPRFPGIFAGERMSDWAPPFPIDHARITEDDEDYWRRFNMAPKAFVPIDVGQRMWSSPRGRLTSMRAFDPSRTPDALAAQLAGRLSAGLSVETMAVTVRGARQDALAAVGRAASRSARVFLYSVMLIVAGLLVVAAGAGPDPPRERSTIAAAVGSAAGSIGAIGHAAFVLHGLRTWWVDAGSAALALHVSAVPLSAGVTCGWLLAVGVLDLRVVRPKPDAAEIPGRAAGAIEPRASRSPSLAAPLLVALSAGPAGLIAIALSLIEVLPLGAGFIAAGVLCLTAALACLAFALRRHENRVASVSGLRGVLRPGFHAAAVRPGRSVCAAALIAVAVFVIMAAGAVGPRERSAPITRRSGAGGFSLVAESAVPVVHDLDTSEGQRAIGLGLPLDLPLAGARFMRFRFRPGDDVSPANLLRAVQPAALGAPADFIQGARFAFAGARAEAPDERLNPWLLLEKTLPDGAVPVVADRQSLRTLGTGLGGAVRILDGRGQPATLRVVAVLTSSVFQHAVVMAGDSFTRLFPDSEGFRFFLIDVEPRWAPALSTRLDTQLTSLGFESALAADRLASFARAPRAAIAAFRTLGLLGLIVGILGVASASLARARGGAETPAPPSLVGIVWIVGVGLAAGAAAALLALAPSFLAAPFYN
jgi:hypothetical protein